MAKRRDEQVRALARTALAIENGGAKEFVALVNELRRNIILSIIEQGALTKREADIIKQHVSRLVLDYNKRFAALLTENERRLFVKGIQIVDAILKRAELTIAVPYLSEQLLQRIQEYSADLITNITEDIRRRVTQELDLAVLGQKPQTDVVKAIGKNLTSPSIFGTIAKRSEVIFRTEVNRVHNLAAAERIRQVANSVSGNRIRKRWMHSHQGAPRPNHLALDGVEVDAGARFELRGRNGKVYMILAPHDPILPAEEVVNCRCQVIPVVAK